MKALAVKYYNEGYNCSQSIISAAQAFFSLDIPEECIGMCSAVSNGFGVGAYCCALVAGTIVFGMMFDEKTAKRLSIQLTYEFSYRHEGITCDKLKKYKGSDYDCGEIIGDTADIVCRLIEEELAAGSRFS